MVRLKAANVAGVPFANPCFNSKMVRLKGLRFILCFSQNGSFNSKMVRLKDEGGESNSVPKLMFQFQNGTIKSGQKSKPPPKPTPFQFQNGTIKSCLILFSLQKIMLVSIPKWYD